MSVYDEMAIFDDGYVFCGDCTSYGLQSSIRQLVGDVGLIVADPPYGNIVNEKWDRINTSDDVFARWMIDWTQSLTKKCLVAGGAFYVWGGVGIPGFRPFLKYVTDVEVTKGADRFELANLITWGKKRAYGVKHNYLWTREECAYFVNGDAKKPRTFNIPLLETKRGYAGFNAKYPAKSEFYRRTNVWTDITEIMQGKLHPTQKKQRVIEIPIEVHTNLGEWVIDPFAGAGTTAMAARKLGRKFVLIEQDRAYFDAIVKLLKYDKTVKYDTDHANT